MKISDPTAIIIHKLTPRAKLLNPDFLISLMVILDPIRNNATTIPRLPNQLKWE